LLQKCEFGVIWLSAHSNLFFCVKVLPSDEPPRVQKLGNDVFPVPLSSKFSRFTFLRAEQQNMP